MDQLGPAAGHAAFSLFRDSLVHRVDGDNDSTQQIQCNGMHGSYVCAATTRGQPSINGCGESTFAHDDLLLEANTGGDGVSLACENKLYDAALLPHATFPDGSPARSELGALGFGLTLPSSPFLSSGAYELDWLAPLVSSPLLSLGDVQQGAQPTNIHVQVGGLVPTLL
jgi:hypothetical protein